MKKIVVILIFLVTSSHLLFSQEGEKLTIVSSFTADSLIVSDLYLQGVKKIHEGKISDGYSIFLDILKREPDHAPTLYKLSQILSDQNKSLGYLERAVALDSANLDYKYGLAGKLLAMESGEKAIEVSKELVALDHANVNAHIYQISAYDVAKQPFAAIAAIDSAMVVFGNSEQFMLMKQELASKNRLYRFAVENGEKLVSLYPDNVQYLTSTAEAYAAEGNFAKADEYYAKATEIDSQNIQLLFSKYIYYQNRNNAKGYFDALNGLMLHKDIDADRKIEFFAQLLDDNNLYKSHYFEVDKLVNNLRSQYADIEKVQKIYASHLIKSGELERALVQFKELADGNKTDKDLAFQAVELELYLRKSIDSVAQDIDTLLIRFPKDVDMMQRVALLYSRQEEYKEAIKISKGIIKQSESDSIKSVSYGFIGDTYSAIGDQKKCYKAYDKALKYDPNNILVLNNYSYFLSEENRELDKALKMAQVVMKHEPDNATYIDTYGWILFKLGEYEMAKKQIRRAIALDEYNNSELLLHMGDIFFALGDKMSAQSYWNRAENAGAEKSLIEERRKW